MHQNVSRLGSASFYDRLLLLAARKKAINNSTAVTESRPKGFSKPGSVVSSSARLRTQ